MRRPSWRTDLCWQSLEDRRLCASVAVAAPRSGTSAETVRDLGDISEQQAAAGIRAVAWIPPGGRVSFRLTLDLGADFVLWCRYTGDRVALYAKLPDGKATLYPGAPGIFQAHPLALGAGEYLITAASKGTQPIFIDWELILDNGVSQAAAISLSASSPAGDGAFATGGVAPLNVTFTPPASPTSNGPGVQVSTLNSGAPSSPAGLALVPESVPLGRPTSANDHIAAVGPMVEGVTLAALADARSGLDPALFMTRRPEPTHSVTADPDMTPADEVRSAAMDAAVLASTDWIERAVASLTSPFHDDGEPSVEAPPPPDQIERAPVVHRYQASITYPETMHTALLIPIAAIAYHYRQWKRGPSSPLPEAFPAYLRGPMRKFHPFRPAPVSSLLNGPWRRRATRIRSSR